MKVHAVLWATASFVLGVGPTYGQKDNDRFRWELHSQGSQATQTPQSTIIFLRCKSDETTAVQFELDLSSKTMVFRYSGNRQENTRGSIRISDTHYVLNYIYNGRIDVTWSIQRHGGFASREAYSIARNELIGSGDNYRCEKIDKLQPPSKPDF